MMMFIHRNGKYKGMQFTGKNRDEMARFLGVTHSPYCELWRNEVTGVCFLKVDAPGCSLGSITEGYWVLKRLDLGEYAVLSPERLLDLYEEL